MNTLFVFLNSFVFSQNARCTDDNERMGLSLTKNFFQSGKFLLEQHNPIMNPTVKIPIELVMQFSNGAWTGFGML